MLILFTKNCCCCKFVHDEHALGMTSDAFLKNMCSLIFLEDSLGQGLFHISIHEFWTESCKKNTLGFFGKLLKLACFLVNNNFTYIVLLCVKLQSSRTKNCGNESKYQYLPCPICQNIT